ncbi:unnamed protein product [Urochloa decumbens]|uniref:Uncharacterized protein n=1 Tax=Urochloa decumbens TaxID=240449 RepID=A0ABC9DAY2_9POAL
MELAMGAMGPLFPKLLQLLEDKYVAQRGLKREVESLSRELAMVHAALAEVSRAPPERLTEPDKLWARQIRELSYDMEDAVDAFILRVARLELAATADGAKEVLKRIAGKATKMVKKIKERHQISEKIKDIKNLSKELSELRTRYTFSGGAPAVNTGVDPRVINLYKNEGDLVGVEEARDELIWKLTCPEDNKSLKIVSIVGSGGLGKTTLAKLAYDQLKAQSFDCWAFVSVGRNPNVTNTLREMLEKLDQKSSREVDMASWNGERFCEELYKFLQGKRYIIVVDDLWDKETWKTIKHALQDSNCGSRVIITTRNSEVSTKANDVYKLKPLSHEKSKELFYKRVSRRNGDNQLDNVSNKIIDKCDGVPLAIIAIASLLVDRPLEDWEKVYESIVFGYEEDKTRTILLYSYYDLPSYLKPCLLYLSMYPEDHLIEKSTLVWSWIAEGFVQLQKMGDNLFEVGEMYFNELLNRSMIQPEENKQDGSIDGCRVHDIVLDIIRDLSREENFVTILVEKQCALPECVTRMKEVSLYGSERKVRRLSIQRCRMERIPQDAMGLPEVLRSLNIMSSEIEVIPPLSSFQACRVLVIEGRRTTLELKHLGKLLHLRYLEINGATGCSELPKEIGNLKFLQTLVLKETGIDELPPAVCELPQLLCLHVMGGRRVTVPGNRMGKLVRLEQLKLRHVEEAEADDFLFELGKLTRLRVLDLEFYSNIKDSSLKALVLSLSNLVEIRELKLRSDEVPLAWEDWRPPQQLWHLNLYRIDFYPQLMNPSSFGRLRSFYLFKQVVEAKDMESLSLLPELQYLEMRGSTLHQGIVVGAEGFKNLRVCRVPTTFRFLPGAMPRLESLLLAIAMEYGKVIVQYRKVILEQLPTRYAIPDLDFGLGNLVSLKEVTVNIQCSGSILPDVEEAEAALRRAIEDHPTRPTLHLRRSTEEYMLSDYEVQPEKATCLGVNAREMGKFTLHGYVQILNPYSWLEKITIGIDCEGARLCEVKEIEAMFKLAATVHRNRPILLTNRINEDKMDCNSEPEKVPDLLLSVRDMKDNHPRFDHLHAMQISCRWLEEINVDIDCTGARLCEVESLEVVLRFAAAAHPKRPTLHMKRINEDKMASSS